MNVRLTLVRMVPHVTMDRTSTRAPVLLDTLVPTVTWVRKLFKCFILIGCMCNWKLNFSNW